MAGDGRRLPSSEGPRQSVQKAPRTVDPPTCPELTAVRADRLNKLCGAWERTAGDSIGSVQTRADPAESLALVFSPLHFTHSSALLLVR